MGCTRAFTPLLPDTYDFGEPEVRFLVHDFRYVFIRIEWFSSTESFISWNLPDMRCTSPQNLEISRLDTSPHSP